MTDPSVVLPSAFVFLGFADWVAWIRRLIANEPVHPEVSGGPERPSPDDVLVHLSRLLPNNRSAFIEALALVYEEASPTRPESLYYLLNAISVIRPANSKHLLGRHLRERRYDGIRYAGADLQALCVLARSTYDIDADSADWLEQSALAIDRFSYRLAVFRALAKISVERALCLYDILLPHLEKAQNKATFEETLRLVLWYEGCAGLYDFVFTHGGARVAAFRARNPAALRHLKSILLEHVLPWRPDRYWRSLPESSEMNCPDPYAALTAAQLAAGRHLFVAEEVTLIAQLIRHPSLPIAGVRGTLQAIWKESTDFDAEHVEPSVDAPWTLERSASPPRVRTNWRPQHDCRQLMRQEVDVADRAVADLLFETTLPSKQRQAWVQYQAQIKSSDDQ